MTKSQCYSEIARNNQLIAGYQSQINSLNSEITELTTTRVKIVNMKTTLASCKQTGSRRLADTSKVGKINSKLIGKIYKNMNSLFEGIEYQSVKNGLDSAISRVDEEIENKKKQIQALNSNISQCQSTINRMNNTISQIEAQERAEAARRAEAERQAAAQREEKNKK